MFQPFRQSFYSNNIADKQAASTYIFNIPTHSLPVRPITHTILANNLPNVSWAAFLHGKQKTKNKKTNLQTRYQFTLTAKKTSKARKMNLPGRQKHSQKSQQVLVQQNCQADEDSHRPVTQTVPFVRNTG